MNVVYWLKVQQELIAQKQKDIDSRSIEVGYARVCLVPLAQELDEVYSAHHHCLVQGHRPEPEGRGSEEGWRRR